MASFLAGVACGAALTVCGLFAGGRLLLRWVVLGRRRLPKT